MSSSYIFRLRKHIEIDRKVIPQIDGKVGVDYSEKLIETE